MKEFNFIKIFILGDSDQISSEKYFVTISTLIASFTLFILFNINLFMGLSNTVVILTGSSFVLMLGLYYLVRYRNMLSLSKTILTIVSLILLDFSWYSKYLSNGPVLSFILIFIALVIWIWHGKQLWYLIIFYFVNLAVLFYIDYNAPAYLFKYPETISRSVVIFLSIFAYSILLLTLLYFVKRQFLKQENKLKKINELYSSLFNNTTIGLYQSTPSGDVLSANLTLIKMLNYDSLEDLLQKDLTKGSYVDNKKREEFKKIIKEKGEIIDFESEWYTKDGKIITVLESAKAVKNKKGEIEYYDGTVNNITENKKIRSELIKEKLRAQENEKKLEEAQTLAHIGNWDLDFASNTLKWSDEIYRIFGCKPQSFDATYDTFLGFVHPDDKDDVNNAYLTHVKNKTPYNINHRILLPNGEIKYVNERCTSVYDLNGDTIRSFGTVLDITDSVIIQKELLEAKLKAEENNRLKSNFLANMSHEIRTPMNSILGFSDLLMDKDITEAKQEKYHEIINSSGKRLMSLINDIVDISKIDANELKLSPAVFNLNKLIDQLEHQFLISPKNNNTKISSIKVLKDDDSFIDLDENRLSQVLSNLLENAFKYTHNGTIEFGYSIKGTMLQFYVKDSGVGITKEDQKLIFERFGQSDNEILRVKEGSGLGLSISKGIVELFGGEIWVESELNKGATFFFTVPNSLVQKPKENDEVIESIKIQNNLTKTILIAEDEESNFYFIEAALDGYPFELVHVENGKDVVEIMSNKHSIDLILMDFNMPIMNGLDATKEIRKTNKTVPIIALTAYAMTSDKEMALEIGCTDYLSKPVSRVLLLEMINKYISS